MQIYRICPEAFLEDYRGLGASYRDGARWNHPGSPVQYFAASASVAMLELGESSVVVIITEMDVRPVIFLSVMRGCMKVKIPASPKMNPDICWCIAYSRRGRPNYL